MRAYKSRYSQTSSSSHATVIRAARSESHKIQKLTPRRQPYVKSKYFKKDKIFVSLFWEHLKQKRLGDQVRRARLYICAIDLIRHSVCDPDSIYGYGDMGTGLHRFYGQSKEGVNYVVQIKENKRTGRKDFMSVFPVDKF